ncbi:MULTISPECIES: acyltransferase [unclassified Limnobacter]|uniref:acyltransferase family protein n=1 Tax=unclassified Limnobacter TaxID=2630203 RepID=UPI000C42CDCD|nr:MULTISPECIES: acyltransferase [unclassified Limnobacter]MAZ08567.1 hypothetical protein [Sutterellaceae bacterium]|tara:strand:+ start:27014 stop:28816 length:1803 start_codon:yes stop_codon:yes gene_type:complete
MTVVYRPEIDGLRALAVLSVVLFHAKVPGFENGFLGVDIFFVISGFLITTIILREHAGSGFSYLNFVTRRARRILPALGVVTIACMPFAYWLMLPDALENFGQSLVATTLSANNILLWLTSGYWDLSSEYKPLLHTWSLGVEEQFYVLYPLLLIGLFKFRRSALLIGLSGLAVLSFCLMVYELNRDAAAAFYLLHCRAWQLLVGGIAALTATRFEMKPSEQWAGLGVVMMLASMLPWPAEGSLLPVHMVLATVGAALYLLWASSNLRVTWPFTQRAVVFTGLISYSFYLWHQPVFAFLRVALFEEPRPLAVALAGLLCFGLAALTWRYIEVPFRSPTKVPPRRFWPMIVITTVASLFVGMAMHFSSGFPERLNYPDEQGAAGGAIAYNERIRRILPNIVPANKELPVVLVAGNSFARDFANVLIEAGLSESLTLVYRDDVSACSAEWSNDQKQLVSSVDFVIFAGVTYGRTCIEGNVAASGALSVPFRYVGPKHFGNNPNPLVRMTTEERVAVRLKVPEIILIRNASQKKYLRNLYIDLLPVLAEDGRHIRVANDQGILLSTDNIHLSKAGAVYLANELEHLMPEIFQLAKTRRPIETAQ